MKTIIAADFRTKSLGAIARAVQTSGVEVTEVANGNGGGGCRFVLQYARLAGTPVRQFPADWKRYGRAAGRQRNLQMAVYADALIAVWDGKSPGTRHMIETAKRMGLKVFVYRTDLEH